MNIFFGPTSLGRSTSNPACTKQEPHTIKHSSGENTYNVVFYSNVSGDANASAKYTVFDAKTGQPITNGIVGKGKFNWDQNPPNPATASLNLIIQRADQEKSKLKSIEEGNVRTFLVKFGKQGMPEDRLKEIAKCHPSLIEDLNRRECPNWTTLLVEHSKSKETTELVLNGGDERLNLPLRLGRTTIQNVRFQNIDFSKCDFDLSILQGCTFENCTFGKFEAPKLTLKGCVFEDCTFVETNLNALNAQGTTFSKCNFYGVSFLTVSKGNDHLRTTLCDCKILNCSFNDPAENKLSYGALNLVDCDVDGNQWKYQGIEVHSAHNCRFAKDDAEKLQETHSMPFPRLITKCTVGSGDDTKPKSFIINDTLYAPSAAHSFGVR